MPNPRRFKVRVVAISDTHGTHRELAPLPDGDILIHAGDFCLKGKDFDELIHFNLWLGEQPHQLKIVVPGNHDGICESDSYLARLLLHNATYLENTGCERMGLKFWGSPQTPMFQDWAFMAERGEAIARYWRGIPGDTDVLITHGPPYGQLDAYHGKHVGCYDLAEAIARRQIPYNIFGHIHVGHGQSEFKGTKFFNVAMTSLVEVETEDGKTSHAYRPAYPATVIDIEVEQGFELLEDKPWR